MYFSAFRRQRGGDSRMFGGDEVNRHVTRQQRPSDLAARPDHRDDSTEHEGGTMLSPFTLAAYSRDGFIVLPDTQVEALRRVTGSGGQ
jgi:hypothetical protein